MLKLLRCRGARELARNGNSFFKRFFLSDAFKCTEAWENRLKAPIFKKVNNEVLYNELEKSMSIGYRVNVLDVDLFVNSVKDEYFQNELEEILFKLRLNPETRIMPERASHAVIRWYLSLDKKEDLLNVLGQRLSYGVFPDVYLSVLMMDTFLKQNDVVSAAKAAVLQMLQEDCDHPVLRTLALYSCVKYLNSEDVWAVPKNLEEDDDDEIVKVRVPFLRNEYFDDHFDIVNTNHLIGKTMYLFGKTIQGPIGASSQLIGLILYDKFDKAKFLLEDLNQSNGSLYKEAVDKAKDYLRKTPKQSVEETGEKKEEEGSSEGEDAPIKAEIGKLLDGIAGKRLLSGNLQEDIEDILKREIAENQDKMIKQQCEVYKQWEKEREDHIDEEVKESERRKVQEEIARTRAELEAEEEKIFYFDREEANEEIYEQKKLRMENIRVYKPKIKTEKDKMEVYTRR